MDGGRTRTLPLAESGWVFDFHCEIDFLFSPCTLFYLSQLAEYESALERHARTQLAVALQDSARQACLARLALVRAADRLERRCAHRIAVQSEVAERQQRIERMEAAQQESRQLRAENKRAADILAESTLQAHAEEDAIVKHEMNEERARAREQTERSCEDERLEFVRQRRNAQVTRMMDRHHSWTQAQRDYKQVRSLF